MIPENFSPEKINVVAIMQIGRASSIFFQGLFGKHPQAVTLPSTNYPSQPKKGAIPQSIAIFEFGQNINFIFDPAYPIPEGSSIRKEEFVRHFCDYLLEYGTSRKTIFLARHYAFAKATGTDTSKIRCILFGAHDLMHSSRLFNDFPHIKCVVLARDPRANYISFTKKSQFPCWQVYMVMPQLLFTCTKAFVQQNTIYVRHEDVHCNYLTTIHGICNFLSLPFHSSMEQSSYYGIPYTGNFSWASVTGHLSASPSPKYVTDNWKRELSENKIWLLNLLNAGVIRRFGYEQFPARLRTNPSLSLINKTMRRFAEKVKLLRSNESRRSSRAIRALFCKIPLIGKPVGEAMVLLVSILAALFANWLQLVKLLLSAVLAFIELSFAKYKNQHSANPHASQSTP